MEVKVNFMQTVSGSTPPTDNTYVPPLSNIPNPPPAPCPHCGHCPTCGRRNAWPQWDYNTPYWTPWGVGTPPYTVYC